MVIGMSYYVQSVQLTPWRCQLSDAQRPCSTCVRSHAHALSHAPAGIIIPERPECTFDEGILHYPLVIQYLIPCDY